MNPDLRYFLPFFSIMRRGRRQEVINDSAKRGNAAVVNLNEPSVTHP